MGATCEILAGCPFFNSDGGSKPATAAALKIEYCLSPRHRRCARLAVAEALGTVPLSLRPDDLHEAIDLIAFHKKDMAG